jgi:hypothetical protein
MKTFALRLAVASIVVSSFLKCDMEQPTAEIPSPTRLTKIASSGESVNALLSGSRGSYSLPVQVEVSKSGKPLVGVEIGFSRSTSGLASTYQWTAITDSNGRAQVQIDVDPGGIYARDGVQGYYHCRARDLSSGEVVGQWGSIPLNADESRQLVFSVGQGVAFTSPPAPGEAPQFRLPPADFPTPNRDCRFCDLSRVNLAQTNLVQSILFGSDLTGADFHNADMYEVDLRSATLTNVNMSGTLLEGARLDSARFVGANLAGADLNRADMLGVDLTRANLRGANLRTADMRGAILIGADLTGAVLTGARLGNATWIDGTRCGDGSIGQCNR